MIKMKRKNLFCLFIILSLILVISIFILLHSEVYDVEHGYLEVYDVEHGRNGILTTTFYLRWHGKKTEVKIKYWGLGGKTQNLTVNDGDTFTVTTPTVVQRNLYTEIRYDRKVFILSPSTGELQEISWY